MAPALKAGEPQGLVGSIPTLSASLYIMSQSPNIFTKAVNLARATLAHVASGCERTPLMLFNHRVAICDNCPERADDACRVCGCYVAIKASWYTQRCPLDKW